MRNQKRSETIFLQYCMFNILPILNFKDFSYCCNFEHNYPDNQRIKNCQFLSFTRRDRSTPYLQPQSFSTVQCSDFILEEHRESFLKITFFPWKNGFRISVFGYRAIVLLYKQHIVQCSDFDSVDLQFCMIYLALIIRSTVTLLSFREDTTFLHCPVQRPIDRAVSYPLVTIIVINIIVIAS